MRKRKTSHSVDPKRLDEWAAERFNHLPNYDAIATAEDCVWNPRAARHVIDFVEHVCRFTEGEWAGAKFVLLPWQRCLLANLYGWLRPDGTRRFRQAHILIPRKAGKTELAAALALYHLLADDEPTPEVVGIARDRAQARLCLKRACSMASQEPRIGAQTQQYQGRLVCPQNYGVYKVLSSDAPSAHGLNTSACIADEIHAMENRRELWEAVMTSMGARKQPLMVSITTAGVLRESLEYDLFEYAKKVCSGIVKNKGFLPCLYYADMDADWKNETTWRQANPSLGYTTSVDWYTTEARRAHDQPSYESPFRTYFLCQHITTSHRWIRMSDWDKCSNHEWFSEDKLKTLPCYIGIDLAQTTDLTSLALLWVDGDKLITRSYNYAPEAGAHIRSTRDGVPYEEWSRNGWLTLTSGDTTDYGYLREQVFEFAKKYRVRHIAYDPYNAQNLGNELEQGGLSVFRCPQSFLQLATPTRMLERAIIAHEMIHDGNPVLAWAMSNVVVDRDSVGNPRPSKKRSVERIDPVIALTIAIAAATHDEKQRKSIYESRGLIWL